MQVVQNPELTLHELGDECVLHSQQNRKVHVLNQSAQFIWNQCKKPTTPEQIADRLQAHYKIAAETARTDTLKTVDTLIEKCILTRADQ